MSEENSVDPGNPHYDEDTGTVTFSHFAALVELYKDVPFKKGDKYFQQITGIGLPNDSYDNDYRHFVGSLYYQYDFPEGYRQYSRRLETYNRIVWETVDEPPTSEQSGHARWDGHWLGRGTEFVIGMQDNFQAGWGSLKDLNGLAITSKIYGSEDAITIFLPYLGEEVSSASYEYDFDNDDSTDDDETPGVGQAALDAVERWVFDPGVRDKLYFRISYDRDDVGDPVPGKKYYVLDDTISAGRIYATEGNDTVYFGLRGDYPALKLHLNLGDERSWKVEPTSRNGGLEASYEGSLPAKKFFAWRELSDGDEPAGVSPGFNILKPGPGFPGINIDARDFKAFVRNEYRYFPGSDSSRAVERVIGTQGDDIMLGSDRVDTFNGLGGMDFLFGGGGEDALAGGAGRDFLFGEAGNDILLGGFDSDELRGGEDNDYLNGGTGEDYLFGGEGHDVLFGGLHQEDRKRYFFGERGTLKSRAPGEKFVADGRDRLKGEEGNDVLIAGWGNDVLDGGPGEDTALFADSGWTELQALFPSGRFTMSNLVVNLLDGSATSVQTVRGDGHTTEMAASADLRGIERVISGRGNDSLSGDDNDNFLSSTGGVDTLSGHFGEDHLFVPNAEDGTLLYGGADDDRIEAGGTYWAIAGSGDDYIIGLESSVDANIHGGSDDDTIVLLGGTYEDVSGGRGNDTIFLKLPGHYSSDTHRIVELDDPEEGEAPVRVVHLASEKWIEIDGLWGNEGFDTVILANRNDHDQDSEYSSSGRVVPMAVDLAELDFLHSGIEQFVGTTADDTLLGTDDDEVINGNDGDDVLAGRDGNDVLIGAYGSNFYGGDGDDTFVLGWGDHSEDVGGAAPVFGDNQILGGTGPGFVYLKKNPYRDDPEYFRVRLVDPDDPASGTQHKLIFEVSVRHDARFIDDIDWLEPANEIQGGDGIDTVKFLRKEMDMTGLTLLDFLKAGTFGLDVDLGRGTARYGWDLYNLSSIENITGTNENDRIVGDDGSNTLFGMGGASDYIHGKGGDDLIGVSASLSNTAFGGEGDDILILSKSHEEALFAGPDIYMGGHGLGRTDGDGGAGDDLLIIATDALAHARGGSGSDTFHVTGVEPATEGEPATEIWIYGDAYYEGDFKRGSIDQDDIGATGADDIDSVLFEGSISEWSFREDHERGTRGKEIVAEHKQYGTVYLNGIENIAFAARPDLGFQLDGSGEHTLNLSIYSLLLDPAEYVVLYNVPDGVTIANDGAVKGTQALNGSWTWTLSPEQASAIEFRGEDLATVEGVGVTTTVDISDVVTSTPDWRTKISTEIVALTHHGPLTGTDSDTTEVTLYGMDLEGKDGDIVQMFAITTVDTAERNEILAQFRSSGLLVKAPDTDGDDDDGDDDHAVDHNKYNALYSNGASNYGGWDHSSIEESGGYKEFSYSDGVFHFSAEASAGTRNAMEYSDGNLLIYSKSSASVTATVGVGEHQVHDDGSELYWHVQVTGNAGANVENGLEFSPDEGRFRVHSDLYVGATATASATVQGSSPIGDAGVYTEAHVGVEARQMLDVGTTETEDGERQAKFQYESFAMAGGWVMVSPSLGSPKGNFGGSLTLGAAANFNGKTMALYSTTGRSDNGTPTVTLGFFDGVGFIAGIGIGASITIPAIDPLTAIEHELGAPDGYITEGKMFTSSKMNDVLGVGFVNDILSGADLGDALDDFLDELF